MPGDITVVRKKGEPTHGKTDHERLKKMTEEEIEQNALDDPDALPMSDEEMKGFKRVVPKKEK